MHFLLRLFALIASACILVFGFTSCAVIGRNAKIVGQDFKDLTGFGDDEKKGSSLKKLSDVQATTTTDASQLYSEDKIVWADEDPNIPMVDLEGVWKTGPRDNWYESYTEAMRIARKDGKPVLLWFTNSDRNSASQSLDKELFSHAEFEDWAKENVIRLRIDTNIVEDDQKLRDKKRKYISQLRKQYKVMGAPVVLVVSPRGTQFGKYRGYKTGGSLFYFGRLKSAHRNAMADYGNWRAEYEAKGYRTWHDNKGRKVFAKPVGLEQGVIMLKNPEGKRSKTPLNKLSRDDQAWVADYLERQKK
ncbi:MAG: thioredoxin family protein [Rubritalea sp.]|uniref:thioredoxin family protein n=1 Tax=Rubritalea sp. TaxID=2109375 RepID=UPI003242DA70